jgi:hypothetical protein
VEWTILGFSIALILARLYLQLVLQRKRLFLSDYFICLAWLSGIWGAALDIELKKLGWLNPSTTWPKFESVANRRYLTQEVSMSGYLNYLGCMLSFNSYYLFHGFLS